MNKSDVIDALVARGKLPKQQAQGVTELILATMTQALAVGERIEIRDFGRLISKAYGARTGRNPRTGHMIQVAAKRLPFFKAGKQLRERIDQMVEQHTTDTQRCGSS